MAIPAWGISLLIGGGSMVLQYLLQPKVKTQPTDKGKMDDIRITGSEYGTIIPRVRGKARIGGNLIFSTGITHTIQNTPSGGGKGVPQAPATRTHTYTTSIGVYICRGEVNNFYRTWADADLILGNGEIATGQFEAEDGTLAGGATTAVDAGASGGEYVTGLGSGGKVTFDFSSVADPPSPNIDDPDEIALSYTRVELFYKCAADRTATLDPDTGATQTISFAATGTDWTVRTVQFPGFIDTLEFANAGGTAPDLDVVTIEKYWFIDILDNPETYKAPTYNVTGAVNQNIIYPLDVDDPSAFYNAALTDDGTGKIAVTIPQASTRYYKGTETQTADAALVSWLDSRYGAGEGDLRSPAMRGIAYVVFENRILRQARVENFTFEVDCGDNTVNDILELLFADAGLTASDYTITATNGLTMIGWIEAVTASRRQLVEQLERYFQFRIAEIDGKIKTVLDTAVSSATIDADLLRAHDYGSDMPAFDGEIIIKEESQLPREVRVSILNPDLEYRNESVVAQLFGSLSATETADYAFPIVDKAGTARTVAEKLILKAYSEDRAVEFYGMPEMAIYSIGDVITVPLNGVEVKIRIEKKQMTLPLGRIRFQGVTVSAFTPTYYQDEFTAFTQVRRQQLVTMNFPRNSIVIPIQSQPITDAERGRLGVYLAICGRGRGASENHGLYREFDTDNYVLQRVVDVPAVAGLCENSQDIDGGQTVGVEDVTTVLDIWFFDAITLESVTAPDLARYPTLNLLRVGDEWMQFKTATAQTLEENSPYRSKWRVTNLQRGLFGTSGEIAGHGDGEYAVLFTPAMIFYDLDSSDIGETVTFKAVTNGQSEENGQIASFTFAPVSAYTVTNGTADRTFDANATTVDELADVVATIIDDLNL